MTVVVKSSKSIVEAKKDTQLHGKADHVLKTNEVNEFNMQSNKERKKVNCVTVGAGIETGGYSAAFCARGPRLDPQVCPQILLLTFLLSV